MVFRRKMRGPSKRERVLGDDVLIGAAKTIGAAIGAASVVLDIGKKSAREAREMRVSAIKPAPVEKTVLADSKAGRLFRPAPKRSRGKATEAKITAVMKAEKTKIPDIAKAGAAKDVAGGKVDELHQVAADSIAPKRRRGLLGRLHR